MNISKRKSKIEQLETLNISERDRLKVQYELYKMDNQPDWMMRIFFGMCLVSLLIVTILFV